MKQLIALFLITFSLIISGCGSSTPTKQELALSAYKKAIGGDFGNLLKMAEHGNVTAQFFLGALYEGRQKVANRADWEQYDKWHSKYPTGHKYVTNYKMAIYWYSKAVQQDSPEAHFNLANMYLNGIGVETNVDKAMELYTRSAELGDVDSQYLLGTFFSKGNLVPKNMTLALKWYQKAADQGHSKASIFLIDYEDKNSIN